MLLCFNEFISKSSHRDGFSVISELMFHKEILGKDSMPILEAAICIGKMRYTFMLFALQ